MTESVNKNHYIALYKAIITKDIAKTVKLGELNEEEEENYPNEFPEIDYDEIFADNDPFDVLAKLLKTEDGFSEYTYDLLNTLASDEKIAKRKELLEELKQYPLIKYCPNPDFGLNIIDNLASVTYSKLFSYAHFKSAIEFLITKSSVLVDCFASVALSVKDPFTIALVNENITSFNPTHSEYSGGYYNSLTNQLVVTNGNGKIHLPFLSHEFAHKLIHLLFNNKSNPYPKDDDETKTKYHQAIKEVLLNIKEFIKN